MNAGRAPTRPGLAKSRIAHRSPRPFSIGVPVRARRMRAVRRRSCWAVSLAGFLMAWASSRTTRSHVELGQRLDVADGGAVGGDDDVGAADGLGSSSPADARAAPWWTTTRSSGVNRAASAAQLPTTAGGATTRAVPSPPSRAADVGEHGRRLAETHVEGEAAAQLDGVEEAEPRQRLGLVGAELAAEPLGTGHGIGGDVLGPGSRSVAQPGALDGEAAGQRRCPRGPTAWRRISAPVSGSGRPARPVRPPPPSGRPGRARPSAHGSG